MRGKLKPKCFRMALKSLVHIVVNASVHGKFVATYKIALTRVIRGRLHVLRIIRLKAYNRESKRKRFTKILRGKFTLRMVSDDVQVIFRIASVV